MKKHVVFAAGLLLIAAIAYPNQGSARQGPIVVPSDVRSNEPFTFGVSGVVEGEVVEVKTVEGEVVARHKPDNRGRVFLAAGLAAGSYLISSMSHPRTPVRCTVGNGPASSVGDLLKLDAPPSSLNLATGLSLKGGGFCPNASAMAVELGNERVLVLAATAREIQTGPIASNAALGKNDLYVGNLESGQGAAVSDVSCYSLTSQLVNRTLSAGSQTAMEFRMLPEYASAKVRLNVLNGPVTFAGGQSEILIDVVNGKGQVPIYSQGAPGKFNIVWAANWLEDGEGGPGSAERARKWQAQYDKRKKAAEAAQAEAEKAEKAAKEAEGKDNNKKAAEERKKAADKHREAAANHRANKDYTKSAEEERAAAEDSRKQAESHDKEGKSQAPGKDARRDAAESEERAAAAEQREANTEARYDKQKAADGQERAAEGYDRAAKDYRANGEGSKSKDAERSAEAARKEAERLRK